MIVVPDLDRDAVRAGLDSLLDLPDGAHDYVRFRREILEEQLDALDRSSGLDEAWTAGHLLDLLAGLRDRFAAAGRDVSTTRLLLEAGHRTPNALVAWVDDARLAPDGAGLRGHAGSLGAPAEALRFLGRVLAAPFVHAQVRSRPRPSGPVEPSGRCPCCGAHPGLALLTGPLGGRVLCCGVCATRWDQPRLACPACGETAATLSLREPDRPRAWLEACGSCESALKTVDVRDHASWGPHVLPLVEVAASLHLDLLAEREGYLPAPPYAALL